MSVNLRKRKRQNLFTRDIDNLLYSLGDGPSSLDSTINTLEESLVEYLGDLSTETLLFAKSKNRSRIKIDDLPFALRNDPAKLSRLEYVLNVGQKIAKAKKMFDDDDKQMATYGNEDDDEDEDEYDDDNDLDRDKHGNDNKEPGAREATTSTTNSKDKKKKKKKKKQKLSS